MAKAKLRDSPRLLRSPVARGIKADPKKVDRNGGQYGAGIIRGFAVITKGEALGHGGWIDDVFLTQVQQAIHAPDNGVKSRFTHPGLSGDGLARYLGRTVNANVDGDVVRADQHFAGSARRTPDGDLSGYLMDRAEEDSDTFGASISFSHDFNAEEEFITANGGKFDAEGNVVDFKSPDPLNANHLPHFRLKELRAVDIVDSPAANPNGLFHVGQEVAQDAEAIVSYSLGLTDVRPDVTELDIDPDRVAGFVQRFLDRHGLSIVPQKERQDMPTTKQPGEREQSEASQKPEDKPVEKPAELDQSPELDTQDPPQKPDERANGKAFLEAFGPKGGVWFAEGKSFDEAQKLYVEELKAENEALKSEQSELRKQLAEGRGEESPVSFQAAPSDEEKAAGEYSTKIGENLGRFAAGIKIKR